MANLLSTPYFWLWIMINLHSPRVVHITGRSLHVVNQHLHAHLSTCVLDEFRESPGHCQMTQYDLDVNLPIKTATHFI